ncbi:MAG TPA: NADP-dependent oxidoreductase [Acidobacteriaceae bacterium]|nr:NADP-dependent oxidoreductase [Acidobacteriaceae bacterium]
MKAVQLHAYGGVDQLFYEDVPDPKPGPGELLVKVAATSVNPIDWKLRRGDRKDAMPLKLPAILGRDVAGTVLSLGSGTQGFKVGDRIMGLVNRAYAEFLVAKPEDLTHIPDGLNTDDAAALPLVVLTGSQLIEDGVRPKPGQTVLVTGAVGNVGRTAVYVARKHGMKVIAGVKASQQKEAETLGSGQVVALDDDKAIAALGQVDAIADTVGHDVIQKLMPHIRANGVLATVVGAPAGSQGKDFRVQQVWSHPDSKRLHELAEAVAKGEFSIPIAKRMKLSQVREAQTIAEAGGVSKILLIP